MTTGRRCYAECLGDCYGPLSREHPFSEGIFLDAPGVTLSGFAGLPEGVPLRASAMASKVLCKRHNERLSPLDAEMKRVATALKELSDSRASSEVTVDGEKIERWFLKLAAGTAAAGWNAGGEPTENIVRQIFGLEYQIDLRMNILDRIARIEDNDILQNHRHADARMMLCVVRGMPLFFSFGPASTELALQMAKRAGFDTGATLICRPTGFSMLSQLKNKPDARVKFSLRWPRGR